MGCEIPKALKLQFSKPKTHFAGGFVAAKPPFGTWVPFRSLPPYFAAAKWATKMPLHCENASLLRNRLSTAKIKTVPWHPFLNIINSTFLFKPVIWTSNRCHEQPSICSQKRIWSTQKAAKPSKISCRKMKRHKPWRTSGKTWKNEAWEALLKKSFVNN